VGDMADITSEMDDAAGEIELHGLSMDEYDDFGFPESHKARVSVAMSHWETAGYHAHEAVKIMKIITAEVEGGTENPSTI
jgi:hypothetical protein